MNCELRFKHDEKSYILNVGLFLLFLVGLGIFLIVAPKYMDDIIFLSAFRDWLMAHGVVNITDGINSLQYPAPFNSFVEFWQDKYYLDNARLANATVIFFLLIPKWIGSLIALIFWAVAMKLSLNLAGFGLSDKRGNTLALAAALLMWSFGLPWSQHIGAVDYQFNYVIPSGLMMLYLTIAKQNPQGYKLVLAFLFGVIVGAWHEGFTVPVLCGAVCILILFRKYRTVANVTLFVALALGVSWLILAPSFANRLSHTMITGIETNLWQIPIGHFLFMIAIILLIIKIIRKGFGYFASNPLLLFFTVSGIAAFVVQIYSTGSRRAGWWADLSAVILILHMFRDSILSITSRSKVISSLLSASFLLIVFAHWAVVDVYAVRCRNIFDKLINDYALHGTSPQFADIPLFSELPAICFGTPDVGIFTSIYITPAFHGFYHPESADKQFDVIPSRLSGYTSAMGQEIPGGTGWQRFGNLIVAPGNAEYLEKRQLKTRIGGKPGKGGIIKNVLYICHSFRSQADGREYTWIYPWHGDWILQFGDISEIFKSDM